MANAFGSSAAEEHSEFQKLQAKSVTLQNFGFS